MRKQATWIILAAIALNLLAAGILTVRPLLAERSAGLKFQQMQAEYEAEMVADPLDVCRAAHEWMLAQRQMFWRDKSADYDAYLAWLRHFEEKHHAAIPLTLYGDGGQREAEEEADEITRFREAAERSPERP